VHLLDQSVAEAAVSLPAEVALGLLVSSLLQAISAACAGRTTAFAMPGPSTVGRALGATALRFETDSTRAALAKARLLVVA